MLDLFIKHGLLGFWTKPRYFNDVYLILVYGHIYAFLFMHGLVAYEYYKGEILLNVANFDKIFFIDFIDYFKSNNLINLLGSQVLKCSANLNR